jgi:hypothetical protein
LAHCNKYRLHKLLFDQTGDRTRDPPRSIEYATEIKQAITKKKGKLPHVRFHPLHHKKKSPNTPNNELEHIHSEIGYN